MRRLSRAFLITFGLASAIIAAISCSESAITAPPSRPVARIPWGPLGTGGGGYTCGETDIRIADFGTFFNPDTLPKAQGYEQCPPPDATGENWCPNTAQISFEYQEQWFIGPMTKTYWGLAYATYSFYLYSITEPNLWVQGMATLNLIECMIIRNGGAIHNPPNRVITSSGWGV